MTMIKHVSAGNALTAAYVQENLIAGKIFFFFSTLTYYYLHYESVRGQNVQVKKK